MDRLIKRFSGREDGDLFITNRGVAYQRDMSFRVPYDEAYFQKCAGYEGQQIAERINAGRIALVEKYLSRFPFSRDDFVLDVGVGSGEFIKKRRRTFGYDINPVAVDWLKTWGFWAENFGNFRAFTFWDVIEHIDVPEIYFKRIPTGSLLFTSIPIFEDLADIRESRHYRPGEHLYYFTDRGLVEWMQLYGFDLLERQAFEIDAGRDSILDYAFRKRAPEREELLRQYQKMLAPNYAASSTAYLSYVAAEVAKLKPDSILDYGCGRSDLVAHFWRDGERRIGRYDPAIPEYEELPRGQFDLVVCCDVLEHVPMVDVDHVLNEIKAKGESALFVIFLQPARANLPNGRNAHVTLLSREEWLAWLREVFGEAEEITTEWDQVLMARTYHV